MTLPSSRPDAAALGVPKYFTGRPCKRGHMDPRYTTDGSCVSCAIGRAQALYAKDGERIRARHCAAYADNPEPYKERCRRRRLADPERSKREKLADYERNKAGYLRRAAERNQALRLRTPRWLSDEHWQAIDEFYRLRDRASDETGVVHEVDHIVPIQGETVSGLHVPWNLQVIPRQQNKAKANTLVDAALV